VNVNTNFTGSRREREKRAHDGGYACALVAHVVLLYASNAGAYLARARSSLVVAAELTSGDAERTATAFSSTDASVAELLSRAQGDLDSARRKASAWGGRTTALKKRLAGKHRELNRLSKESRHLAELLFLSDIRVLEFSVELHSAYEAMYKTTGDKLRELKQDQQERRRRERSEREEAAAEANAEEQMCYYSLLEVDRDASVLQIRRNFRRLSLLNHPDKFRGGSEEQKAAQTRFVLLGKAYATLTDTKARSRYDVGLRDEGGKARSSSSGAGGDGGGGTDGEESFRYSFRAGGAATATSAPAGGGNGDLQEEGFAVATRTSEQTGERVWVHAPRSGSRSTPNKHAHSSRVRPKWERKCKQHACLADSAPRFDNPSPHGPEYGPRMAHVLDTVRLAPLYHLATLTSQPTPSLPRNPPVPSVPPGRTKRHGHARCECASLADVAVDASALRVVCQSYRRNGYR
jgi:curved DNA-binding protein CbpA